MRFVVENQHRVLRVVGGRKAAVGSDIFVPVLDLGLLGSARLARDAVAGDIAAFRRADGRVLLQDGAHALRGLLGNHLALRRGVRRLYDVALAVHNFPDDVGTHQVAAVRDGRARGDHLNRRDVVGLAERGHGEVQRRHLVLRHIDAARFARQVDAGLIRKAEGVEILEEPVDAKLLADLHEHHVAGVVNPLGKSQPAEAAALPVVDGLPADGQRPGAVERGVFRDQIFFQRRGGGDHLENRARIVGVVHAFVAPLLQLGLLDGRLLLLRVRDFRDGGRRRLVGDGERVVRVEIPFDRHAEDGARFDVHHDGAAPVFHVVVEKALLQVLLQIMLHDLVDGEDKAVAVLRGDLLLVLERHVGPHGVLGRHKAARHARELAVVLRLDAGQALVIRPRKAEDGGRERPVRVVSFIVLH